MEIYNYERRQHQITIEPDPSNSGLEIVKVPIGGNSHGGANAVIYRRDYEYLVELGLSKSWGRYPNGIVIAPAHRARGSQVTVARVLLDARAGQNVEYVDGNRLNLRLENLRLVEGGWAVRRDRDFLTPLGSKAGRPRKSLNNTQQLDINTDTRMG